MEKMLQKIFGYSSFRKGQRETISSILSGNDTVAMLPTGTGKSLCYQLPGYMLEGSVIVVSPLLSLMQDQVDQLMMIGEKRVIAFNSFLSYEEKYRALHQLNEYKFIFTSPEMLKTVSFIERLSKLNIALFVIDEAHCISQWGYDFRPDYLKIGEVRTRLGSPLTLALTATATAEVKQDIKASLAIENSNEFIYSVDRPNIALQVEHVNSSQEKMDVLLDYLRKMKGPGIIYFSSKKMAGRTAMVLKEQGFGDVMAYHGGLTQENRKLIQQQFLYGQLDIICATSAFGMGINKDNLRFVIHFHMPMQLESYLQEIGRAGRDGGNSLALLLYAAGDEQLPLQLAEGELLSDIQIDALLHWFSQVPEGWHQLSAYESEVTAIAGLTETNYRLLKSFNDQAVAAGQGDDSLLTLKQMMANQYNVKRKKINDMLQWIYSSACRRKKILQYFDEELTIKVDNCCDICGIDVNNFTISNHLEKREVESDWEKLLAEILIN